MRNTQLLKNDVKRRRQALGLSQTELALKTGMSQNTVSKVELGFYSDITLGNARALARVFSCSVDQIFPDMTLEERSA
jgi:transcriptional regulator with XRE-family HTH domain